MFCYIPPTVIGLMSKNIPNGTYGINYKKNTDNTVHPY